MSVLESIESFAKEGKVVVVKLESAKDPERLLTIEQLAERLQMAVETVRVKVGEGSIPAIRFNQRLWRFHWPTVVAALQRL